MADVLLTHSYHLFYDSKQVRKMQPYPPLGTLYAAALLRQHGFSVALFDTMLEDPEHGFAAAVARHQPSVVAICEDNFNFLSKMCLTRMREVAFAMIEAATARGATVVANGSDVSDHVEEYLGRGLDIVVRGEVEQTLLEVAQCLASTAPRSRAIDGILGLAFLRNGELVRTPPRPVMADLDQLPFPARDLLDIGHYRDLWRRAHGFFSLNAVSSRGCPFSCNWCARPIYGNRFHIRSAEAVAEEMLELKTAYGADHIWFADDIFALKPRWAAELADEVERRGAALPFKAQARVDLMTPPVARALRRAGCAEVWMGVESGSQKILDAMEKGTRVEQIPLACESLRQEGIRACFFLQFGYPREGWEEILETARLVRRTRPDDIGVSVSYPLPGTAFYARVREELGEKTNWAESDDLALMFKGAYTNDFYRALRDALHAEVDSWREPAAGANGASQRVDELWRTVYRLERASRNVAPTMPARTPCGASLPKSDRALTFG